MLLWENFEFRFIRIGHTVNLVQRVFVWLSCNFMHCYTLGRRVLNIIVAILVQLSWNRATLCTFFMCRFVSLRSNLSTNFDVLFMVRALSFATTFYLLSNLPSRTQAWRNWKGARVIRCDLVDEIVELWLLSGNRDLRPLICELQVTLLSKGSWILQMLAFIRIGVFFCCLFGIFY